MQNRRAAVWLACAKTRMLSLQEPRKHSNVTKPFPSQRVGSGDKTRAKSMWSTVGVVGKCGQHKVQYLWRRCCWFEAKSSQFFWHIWQFDRTYNCLYLEIWQFSCWQQWRRRQTNQLLYPLRMRAAYIFNFHTVCFHLLFTKSIILRRKESVVLRIAVCKHCLKSAEVKLTISTSVSITVIVTVARVQPQYHPYNADQAIIMRWL